MWNVLAQQTVLANVDFQGAFTNFDQWDGYPIARQRLIEHLSSQGINNTVVLTGDIHSYGVATINETIADTESPIIASEFICSSITSTPSNLMDLQELIDLTLPTVPQVLLFNVTQRGYLRCSITPERWLVDLRSVETALVPVSTIQTVATFELKREATELGPIRLDEPV